MSEVFVKASEQEIIKSPKKKRNMAFSSQPNVGEWNLPNQIINFDGFFVGIANEMETGTWGNDEREIIRAV